jgi:scyllo-inositol 2-dehydrogenase (NADP+)
MPSPADRPVSVVLVGFGLGGRLFHAPLIAAAPGLSLDAIVTGNPGRAAQAAELYPGATVYATAEEAWSAGHDLAAISTANVTHVPYAIAALRAGMDVVLDKPIAPDTGAARELADVAATQGRHLIPFQNRRWDSDIRTAQRVMAEGRLGTVHRFESRIVKMRVIPKEGWRGSAAPEDMGGLLYDLGVHAIDQAMQLMGPVTDVSAWTRSIREGDPTDDDTTVVLTHASGAISIVTVSQVTGIDAPRMMVLGTRGGLRIDVADSQEPDMDRGVDPASPDWGIREPGTEALLRTFDDDNNPTEEYVPLERGCWPEFYAQVARAVRGEGPAPVSVADVIETTRVLDAAAQAGRTGSSVHLDPPAAHATA